MNKSAPTNLYQSQKLLSVSLDPVLPIMPMKDIMLQHTLQTVDVDQIINDTPLIQHSRSDWTGSTKLALGLMTTAALVLFLQFYRNRTRPRRIRKSPRLKRVVAPTPNISPSVKAPSVWMFLTVILICGAHLWQHSSDSPSCASFYSRALMSLIRFPSHPSRIPFPSRMYGRSYKCSLWNVHLKEWNHFYIFFWQKYR